MSQWLQRKTTRLQGYDYNTPGAYFLTICTEKRKCVLSRIVGTGLLDGPKTELFYYGAVAEKVICQLNQFYDKLSVESYVIMPNHIHLLVRVCADEYGRPLVAPTMSRVIKQLKGIVTKQARGSIWQKSFHDHIIRSREDYEEHLRYIYENPLRWHYDELYTEE